MAATYGTVNLISSFGFAARWRHQLVHDLPLANASHVVDLMSGRNELCRSIAPQVAPTVRLTAIDISPEMIRRARTTWPFQVEIQLADVLTWDFEPACADAVICSFGLKTFDRDQQDQLAQCVARLLRPGGLFFRRDFSPASASSAFALPVLPQPNNPVDRPSVSRQSRKLSYARRLHAGIRRLPSLCRMSPPPWIGSFRVKLLLRLRIRRPRNQTSRLSWPLTSDAANVRLGNVKFASERAGRGPLKQPGDDFAPKICRLMAHPFRPGTTGYNVPSFSSSNFFNGCRAGKGRKEEGDRPC